LLACFLFASFFHSGQSDTNTLFCYWGSWSTYRWGNGELQANQINPHSCTHLVYAFAGLSVYNDIIALDKWNDVSQPEGGGKDNYRNLVALKRQNPSLKVLLAIGGWNEGSQKFSALVSRPPNRARFISSVVPFLDRYGFDGLDFAWQWPAGRGGISTDKQNYVEFLKELRAAFGTKYTLSVAGPALEADIRAGFDLPQIMNHVDFINVYAYDYDVTPGVLVHGSPLNNPALKQNSVSNTIELYLSNGADPNKVLLGITLYGRTRALLSNSQTSIGDRAFGLGPPGPFTQTSGLLAWFELCTKLKDERFTETYDSNYGVAYAYNDYDWVGYENNRSLAEKVNYAKSKRLGGIMVWSLDNDDSRKLCGDSLASSIRNLL